MLLKKDPCLVVLPVLFVLSLACRNVHTATDLQVHQMQKTQQASGTQQNFAYMVDNAVLSDMSVADVHFVRHTSELSGVGEVRLNTLARLLDTYGGVVRYETQLTDEALIEQRMEHVREYLALTGCDMDRVEVAAMMSGGRGMPGSEAVEKYMKGTEADDADASQTLTLTPGMSSQR